MLFDRLRIRVTVLVILVFAALTPSTAEGQHGNGCRYKCYDCFFIYTGSGGGALTNGTHYYGYGCADVDCPIANCAGNDQDDDAAIDEVLAALEDHDESRLKKVIATQPQLVVNAERSSLQLLAKTSCEADGRPVVLANFPLSPIQVAFLKDEVSRERWPLWAVAPLVVGLVGVGARSRHKE